MKKYLIDTSELANMKLFRSVSNREGLWVVELRGFMLTAFGNVANLGTRRLEIAELARIRQDFSINSRKTLCHSICFGKVSGSQSQQYLG